MPGVSTTSSRPMLTAIIPLGGKAPSLHVLMLWLSAEILSTLKVIIVFDCLKPETSQEFRQTLRKLESSNLEILESSSKNPGGARNVGIEKVTTEWVAFWDSDDIPNARRALEIVASHANGKTIIRGGYGTRNIITGATQEFTDRTQQIQLSELFTAGPGLWRYIFKTDSITDVKFPEISMAEDQIFLLRALSSTRTIEFVSQNLYTYLTNNVNQLTNNKKKIMSLDNAFDFVLDEFRSESSETSDAFETVAARILVTSRLYLPTLMKNIMKFFFTKKITLSTKKRIAKRILNKIKWQVVKP